MPSPKQAYHYQRNCARQRNVPWELTFEMWCEWWHNQLGPDWFRLRGKRPGQYCMARLGDTGPYSVGNIKCIPHAINTSEARTKQLSPEQILAIKAMSGTSADIARQFGASQSWVWRIRNGKARIST